MTLSKKEYYLKKRDSKPDAADRIVTEPTPEQIQSAKKIHIIAVCGKAMASLAELLIEAGYEVSGSDTSFFPPMGPLVKAMKMKVFEEFNEQNIIAQKPDLIVVGNAMGPSNVETAYARANNIPQIGVADALKHFIVKNKKVIVVSGTHGKTTTTGMLAHVLTGCGLNPGYLIGGVDRETQRSAHLGSGEYFVIEGDEYDTAYFDKSPKFLNYGAHSGIITSVEMDHVDIYDDLNDYKQAFTFFAQGLSPEGVLLACGDHASVREIAANSAAPVYSYGLSSHIQEMPFAKGEFVAKNIRIENNVQCADLYQSENLIGTLKTKLFGTYNLQNALAVFGMAHGIGCNVSDILEHIESYIGMKRRQEELFNGTHAEKRITLVDDYAHHPTAVIETLKGLREKYGKRRFVIAFEFGSASSTKRVFEDMYEQAFKEADVVLLRAIEHSATANQDIYLRPNVVAEKINEVAGSTKAFAYATVDEIYSHLISNTENNDVIIIMASNAFGGIQEKLVDYFKN